MRRGVYLEIENYSYGTLLWDVLCEVDLVGYNWVVDLLDLQYGSLQERVYSAEEFEPIIREENIFIFARIRRYPLNSAIEDTMSIKNYEEYRKSACDLAVICVDGGYYEIYAKDAQDQQKLYDACARTDFDSLEWITDENDGRTGFII